MFPNDEVPLSDAELQIIEATEQARVEAAQLELYAEQVFSKTHPKPEAPVLKEFVPTEYERIPFNMEGVTFLNERGVEAWINAAATVGGILFSAIRTAGIFAIAEARLLATYNVQQTTSTILSWAAGFSLVTIIEGVLAGFGWIRGKNSGSINTSWAPIIVAGAIAALAGVLPSFELVPDSARKETWFTAIMWLLVLLSGPGIAYLIFVVTENFGHLHNAWIVDVRQRVADHESEQTRRENDHRAEQRRLLKEIQERNETLQRVYEQALDSWFEMLQDDYRRKGRSLLFGRDSYTVKRTNGSTPKPQQQATTGVTELVRKYLADHGITASDVGEGDGFVISPMGIAQEMDIRKQDGSFNNSGVRTALSRMR